MVVSWTSGSCRWTLTAENSRSDAENSHRDSEHSQSAVIRRDAAEKKLETRLTLFETNAQAIREHIAGNSRSDAENSRWDSEHSQSTAFHLDAAAG